MSTRLRIDYLGSSMDVPATAFAVEHLNRGHEVSSRRQLAEIPTGVAPDVVIHAPLDKTADGLVSTCLLARHVHEQTLLVPMLGDAGNAEGMFALHARRGNCHGKMLMHWLGSQLRPTAVVDKIEMAATSPPRVAVTSEIERSLVIDADQDLGEIMSLRERFAQLLYTAAVHPHWSNWGDLTKLMNVGDGVVKNVNSELGHVLKEARIIPRDDRWTSNRFVSLVADYRSFIAAHGQGHLGFELPEAPLWWRRVG